MKFLSAIFDRPGFAIAAFTFLLAQPVATVAQELRYNYEYSCNRERVVVGHCRRDSDMAGFPRTRDEENYCAVYYPDRPKRNGFTVETVELRGDVIRKLDACGALQQRQESAPQAWPSQTAGGAPSDARTQALTAELNAAKAKREAAKSALQQGDSSAANAGFQSAINDYKRMIASYPYPNFPRIIDAYVALYTIYALNLDKHDLALPVALELRRLQPDKAANAVILGQTYYRLARYDEAMKVMDEALGLAPTADMAAIAHQYKGYIFRERKQYSEALSEAQEEMRLKPNEGSGSHSAGIAYYYLKDYPNAVAAFQKAIQLKYRNPEQSYNWIGYIYNELKQYDKGLPYLQEVLKIKPDYPNTSGNLGYAYLGLKRYPESIAAFKEAVRLEPKSGSRYYDLGYAYMQMGKKPDAEATYAALLQIDKASADRLYKFINQTSLPVAAEAKPAATEQAPPKPAGPRTPADDVFARGEQYFKDGDYQKALIEYQKVPALKPAAALHAGALTKIGRIHAMNGEFEKAQAALLEAIALDPTDENRDELGSIYHDTLQFQKALQLFKDQVRSRPDRPFGYWMLGRTYALMGNKPLATEAYNKLLTLDKQEAGWLLKEIDDASGPAGILLSDAEIEAISGHNAAASRIIQAALTLKPNTAALFKIGALYSDIDKNEEAIAVYRKIIAARPPKKDLADAHSNIGFAYEEMKRYAEALPEYLEAQRIDPGENRSRYVGAMYFRLAQYDKALAAFQDAVKLKPDERDNQYYLGITYSSMQQFDKAVLPLEEAARLDPKNALGFQELGYALYMSKRYQEAAAAFNKALAIEPKRAEALYYLGRSFVRIGVKPQAMRVQAALRPIDAGLAQKLLQEINAP